VIIKKEQLEEHVATNYGNWKQVSNMTRYQHRRKAECLRGEHAKNCMYKLWNLFQNNVSQCKIAKTLNVQLSSVHEIIKRF